MTRKQMVEALQQIERGAIANLGRSAYAKGVAVYVAELIDGVVEQVQNGWIEPDEIQGWQGLRKALLNGAQDWGQYSYGGCSLIYDGDIANRLCTPSEFRRTGGGRKAPNKRETWLDVQARALGMAASAITREAMNMFKHTAA